MQWDFCYQRTGGMTLYVGNNMISLEKFLTLARDEMKKIECPPFGLEGWFISWYLCVKTSMIEKIVF